jgi:hypothetical protein
VQKPKNTFKINDLAHTDTSKNFGAWAKRVYADYQCADDFSQTQMQMIRIQPRNTNANESDSHFGAAL